MKTRVTTLLLLLAMLACGRSAELLASENEIVLNEDRRDHFPGSECN